MKRRRDEWLRRAPGLDPDKLVFIDETWAGTNMTRRRGRCPRGERLVCRVPHGHRKTTTFVAALRTSGMTAPMVIDGALTGELFAAYARQVLAPELRPGDVVVMDNLQCHERAEAVRAIGRAGAAAVYPPPCSPDLNPIENAFPKLKGLVRSAGERTVEGLRNLLGRSLDAFAPQECRNYFRHSCGYSATPHCKRD